MSGSGTVSVRHRAASRGLRRESPWIPGQLLEVTLVRTLLQRRTMSPTLARDFPYALRTFWRNRAFTASAVLILAVGIAASTGLFAVVDAMVLHPLPYAGAERLARVRLLPPSGSAR